MDLGWSLFPVHLPLLLVSVSGVLLARQVQTASTHGHQRSTSPRAKSVGAVFSTALEGLLLATSLWLGRNGSLVFRSYLGVLYLLTLLPPSGLEHVRLAARTQSAALYAVSWLVVILT